jgi:hypothetical protein
VPVHDVSPLEKKEKERAVFEISPRVVEMGIVP